MNDQEFTMVDKALDSDMTHLDTKLFKLAAMLDTTIRFHAGSIDTDEMEQNYLSVWLKKERDPLLVTILATITGARDPSAEDGTEETQADAA